MAIEKATDQFSDHAMGVLVQGGTREENVIVSHVVKNALTNAGFSGVTVQEIDKDFAHETSDKTMLDDLKTRNPGVFAKPINVYMGAAEGKFHNVLNAVAHEAPSASSAPSAHKGVGANGALTLPEQAENETVAA
jgi:hypothetical protein